MDSKFPEVHSVLSRIPYTISWDDVITSYPSLNHCQWSLFFAVITAFIQFIAHLITKLIARRVIGYAKYPPLPRHYNVALSSYYLKLGQHVHYEDHIQISKYDLNNLSTNICDNKLTVSQIKQWLIQCNEFHAKNRLQRKKFQEYLFPIILKSIILSYGVIAIYDQDWIYDRSLFYKGWPYNQGLEQIPDIKLLYLFHMGFYIYRTFRF